MVVLFNKQKICAYLVSVFTVVILFGVASVIGVTEGVVQTGSNNTKLLPIYNVDTSENKVAFTMNCAW
jgi:hypothetical protein